MFFNQELKNTNLPETLQVDSHQARLQCEKRVNKQVRHGDF